MTWSRLTGKWLVLSARQFPFHSAGWIIPRYWPRRTFLMELENWLWTEQRLNRWWRARAVLPSSERLCLEFPQQLPSAERGGGLFIIFFQWIWAVLRWYSFPLVYITLIAAVRERVNYYQRIVKWFTREPSTNRNPPYRRWVTLNEFECLSWGGDVKINIWRNWCWPTIGSSRSNLSAPVICGVGGVGQVSGIERTLIENILYASVALLWTATRSKKYTRGGRDRILTRFVVALT